MSFDAVRCRLAPPGLSSPCILPSSYDPCCKPQPHFSFFSLSSLSPISLSPVSLSPVSPISVSHRRPRTLRKPTKSRSSRDRSAKVRSNPQNPPGKLRLGRKLHPGRCRRAPTGHPPGIPGRRRTLQRDPLCSLLPGNHLDRLENPSDLQTLLARHAPFRNRTDPVLFGPIPNRTRRKRKCKLDRRTGCPGLLLEPIVLDRDASGPLAGILGRRSTGRQGPAMEHWLRYLVDPKRFARHRAGLFVLGQTPCSDASVCWTHRGLSTLGSGLVPGSDRHRIKANLVPVLSGGLKTLGGRTPRRPSFADPLVCNRLDPQTARAQSPPKYPSVRRAPGGLVPRGRMPSSRVQQSLFLLDESFVDHPQWVRG